jgi:hypothetical protein
VRSPCPLNPFTSGLSTGNSHQYRGTLSDASGQLTGNFLTYCVDLFHANPASYGVVSSANPYIPAESGLPATTAQNIGRMGYLYTTYGQFAFTGADAGTKEAALGLAFYELLYDATPDLNTGNFRVLSTTPVSVMAQANQFLTESAGKSYSVLFLDVVQPGDVAPNFSNKQGMLATEQFNFANVPPTVQSPGTVSGTVFVDCNCNGVKDAGESGIKDITLTLTPLEGRSTLTVTTDADGNYSFANVPGGSGYVLTESQPTGFLQGKDTAGNPVQSGVTISQTGTADTMSGITVNGSVGGFNFGEGITSATLDGQLTLTKTTDKATYAPGEPVTYTYVVTNNSLIVMDGITITDDNATPGMAGDDFTVASNVTLAAGESKTFTKTLPAPNVGSTPTVLNTSSSDYPLAGATGRPAIVFNESDVLRAATFDAATGKLNVFYNDERALTLGVSSVTIKTATGSTTTSYTVTPMGTTNPSTATNVQTGATEAQGGIDASGRPLAPSLFLTDLTVSGANSRAGDWQYGGTGISPTAVYGAWKSVTTTIDQTRSPAAVTVTVPADPAKNNWNLGPGSDAVPAGLSNEGYGAEIQWSLADLQSRGLVIPGHTYRFYVMVHDGDQNKSGGDAGQASFTFTFPGVGPITNTATATFADADCNVTVTATGKATITVSGSTSPPPPAAISVVKTASQTQVGLFQPVTYNYQVTNPGATALSGVSLVDDNATPTNPADDFHPTFTGGDANTNGLLDPGEVWTYTATVVPPIAQFATTDAGTNQYVGEIIPVITSNGDLQVTYVQSQSINDNRYGTGATAATGWPGGHKFGDLVGSDKAEFVFTNSAGVKVLDFYVDYISASSAFPSGYGSLGVSGGEGAMLSGSSTYVLSATTSLTTNLLQSQFQTGFLVNSPTETAPNSSVSTPAGWDYNNSYTVVISKAAFGGNVMTGLGTVTVPFQHNSPGKSNFKTPPTPGASTNTVTATATAGGRTVSDTATATITVMPTTGGGSTTGPTKFLVVDRSKETTFGYTAAGGATTQAHLGSGNSDPRGVASNAAGTTHWVIDHNKTVYVYDAAGALLGSWKPGGLDTPEDIATDGTNIWIVDAKKDQVFFYSGAAALRSGSANPTSSFALAAGNLNGLGIVTDGHSLWVVDDAAIDKVFKYTTAGTLLGSWTLDAANSQPRGLTIDPNNVNDIWVVDGGKDAVFRYAGAATVTSGSRTAADQFALAGGATDPQGIADPPPVPVALPGAAGTRTAAFDRLPAPAADLLVTPGPAVVPAAVTLPAPAAAPAVRLPVLVGERLATFDTAPGADARPARTAVAPPTEAGAPRPSDVKAVDELPAGGALRESRNGPDDAWGLGLEPR